MELQSEVPEKYIKKDRNGEPLDDHFPVMEIPVIDLGVLWTSSNSRDELEKLRSALGSWGCFQAINHGMTPEFLDKMREVTKEFFELPMEQKQKYSKENNDFQGYSNFLVLSEQQKLGWSENLYLAIKPEDQCKLELWPEKPEVFRSILHEYSIKLQLITEVVFKAMASSLNLGDDHFLDQYGERAKMSAKFNIYPPCPRPDMVLGMNPHADGSAITLILQDKSTEGLQFLKDNQWFRAPVIPEALLINVGDQAVISSNGIFKSLVHRVVTNSKKERMSLVVFYIPELDKEIEPFEELVDESRPKLYKKVKNYPEFYLRHYQLGKRPIEAARIET
ncbi:Oxoglutarate/iron-dependent dioxygenase [Parasponia andersonii]|uniref:Oxoglutarate/iron-dependent dioxygenase n=1 Tax=Parasponia andersonii TaxID=3476 RepID=A0A2P5D5J7_PARAD|nr:Oxoglutarate/iron-dependent dioxygenase [Parasponia andersonii]